MNEDFNYGKHIPKFGETWDEIINLENQQKQHEELQHQQEELRQTLAGLDIQVEVYTAEGEPVGLSATQLQELTKVVKEMITIKPALIHFKEFNIKSDSITCGKTSFHYQEEDPIRVKMKDIGRLLYKTTDPTIEQPLIKTTIIHTAPYVVSQANREEPKITIKALDMQENVIVDLSQENLKENVEIKETTTVPFKNKHVEVKKKISIIDKILSAAIFIFNIKDNIASFNRDRITKKINKVIAKLGVREEQLVLANNAIKDLEPKIQQQDPKTVNTYKKQMDEVNLLTKYIEKLKQTIISLNEQLHINESEKSISSSTVSAFQMDKLELRTVLAEGAEHLDKQRQMWRKKGMSEKSLAIMYERGLKLLRKEFKLYIETEGRFNKLLDENQAKLKNLSDQMDRTKDQKVIELLENELIGLLSEKNDLLKAKEKTLKAHQESYINELELKPLPINLLEKLHSNFIMPDHLEVPDDIVKQGKDNLLFQVASLRDIFPKETIGQMLDEAMNEVVKACEIYNNINMEFTEGINTLQEVIDFNQDKILSLVLNEKDRKDLNQKILDLKDQQKELIDQKLVELTKQTDIITNVMFKAIPVPSDKFKMELDVEAVSKVGRETLKTLLTIELINLEKSTENLEKNYGGVLDRGVLRLLNTMSQVTQYMPLSENFNKDLNDLQSEIDRFQQDIDIHTTIGKTESLNALNEQLKSLKDRQSKMLEEKKIALDAIQDKILNNLTLPEIR